MSIVKLSTYNKVDELYKMWNQEYGEIFPISKTLFERNLKNAYDNATLVALEDNQPVGFIIGKVWLDEYEVPNYSNFGWISLIYVHPKYRKRGIGSKLLEIVESEFEFLGKTDIHIGKDYFNYFPGLPNDLKESLSWFQKRGYKKLYDTFDLIGRKKDFIPLCNSDKEFRIANMEDKDALISFLNRNWPGRWTKEAVDYWNNGGTGREYLLCVENNQICAFSKVGYSNTPDLLMSYSLTWRNRFKALGGIGPLGVDKAYRGRHLGHDIVAFAKNTLLQSGVSDIIIDWTGLLDFYRPLGFEVWKSYYYLTKSK